MFCCRPDKNKYIAICKLSLISFLFLPLFCYSQTADLQALLKQAEQEKLASHPRWVRLLHLQPKSFSKKQVSNVDEAIFFLAENGKHDPEQELAESLKRLFDTKDDEAHVLCRFPARSRFLIESLNIDDNLLPSIECREYQLWRKKLAIEALWLIFPAAYLNSPSSMFGHTLLRGDTKQDENSSELLSFAINFAANTNNSDSQIAFAYKGLSGGYPGYFTIVPYHKKVKEYNQIENRDIWEYRLNLEIDEIDWLMRHLWELKEKRFDYYFLSHNCSYQLLALLDVARLGDRLVEDFGKQTIPVDTVRSLIDGGWVENAVYRPSKSLEFYHLVEALFENEKKLLLKLQEKSPKELSSELEALSVERQQLVVENAYKLTRLNKKKVPRKQSLDLLKYRSSLGKKEIEDPKIVNPPPEDSHLSNRIGIGMSDRDGEAALTLAYRPAFHSLDDRLLGFTEGAQINFLQTELYITENDLEIGALDVINIRSLSASDRYKKRIAWQVNTGIQRRLLASGKNKLVPHLSVEAGRVYKLGSQRFYALAGLRIEAHKEFDPDLQVGPSINAGWFVQTEKFTQQIRWRYEHFLMDDFQRQNVTWFGQVPLSQNNSIGLEFALEKVSSHEWSSGELTYYHYF